MGCFKVFAKSWDEMTNEQDPSRSICNFSSNSPNSVSTLRGSYSRSKGRCLIRVLQLGRGIFPVNFCTKWLLWNDLTCILTAQARTKSVSAFWAQSGARHFSCKFRSKVALLNFWLAFRLRRLAQSLCVCVYVLDSIRGAAFFLNNPYKVTLVKSHSAFRLSSLGLSCCQSHLRNMLLRLTVSFEQPSRLAIVVLTE